MVKVLENPPLCISSESSTLLRVWSFLLADF